MKFRPILSILIAVLCILDTMSSQAFDPARDQYFNELEIEKSYVLFHELIKDLDAYAKGAQFPKKVLDNYWNNYRNMIYNDEIFKAQKEIVEQIVENKKEMEKEPGF